MAQLLIDAGGALDALTKVGAVLERLLISLLTDDVPFSRAQYNDTPLHYAATWGHYDTVSVLLKGGADPNACDNVRVRWCWGRKVSRELT